MMVQLTYAEICILKEVCESKLYGEVHDGPEWTLFLNAQQKLRYAAQSQEAFDRHQMELFKIQEGGKQ